MHRSQTTSFPLFTLAILLLFLACAGPTVLCSTVAYAFDYSENHHSQHHDTSRDQASCSSTLSSTIPKQDTPLQILFSVLPDSSPSPSQPFFREELQEEPLFLQWELPRYILLSTFLI